MRSSGSLATLGGFLELVILGIALEGLAVFPEGLLDLLTFRRGPSLAMEFLAPRMMGGLLLVSCGPSGFVSRRSE